MPIEPPPQIVQAAIHVGRQSSCAKSTRGAVAYVRFPEPYVVARGYNHVVGGGSCDGSDACQEACSKICVHAEEHVLNQSFFGPRDLRVDIVHVKLVHGELAPSGPPRCWQCSRRMFCDARVEGVWLFHETGWRRYTPTVFHIETLTTCGLPGGHA